MTEVQFDDLDRFVAYAEKQFQLPLLAGCFASERCDPKIPSRAVGLSLLLGEVAHVPSLLQLEEETKLPQWQRWVGYHERISHDAFGYASNRMDPEQLRRAGVFINRKLKRGKSFEESKMHGLLVVSLDANEQFCSDHRCCEECLSREVVCKDAQGNEVKKTQYYHKQVYAQLSGPRLSVILDIEPMRPGEEECAAALRLLRRMRKKYGPRFFDLVVVDAWYTNGPFLKTVVEGTGLAGGGGAQTGTSGHLPGGAGADGGQTDASGGTRRGTQPAPGGNLGRARAALQRHLYRPGAGGPGPGTLDGTHATGQGVEDRREGTNLDLGGGGRTGRLRRGGHPRLWTSALEN